MQEDLWVRLKGAGRQAAGRSCDGDALRGKRDVSSYMMVYYYMHDIDWRYAYCYNHRLEF